MRIAILGATSQIAKDLITSFKEKDDHELILFARNIKVLKEVNSYTDPNTKIHIQNLKEFNKETYFDVIINFIGVGDPAKLKDIGISILETTDSFDEMVISYLHKNPTCKYVFLSSGAVFGSNFSNPVNKDTKSSLDIKNLAPSDWYGAAKYISELKHRDLTELSIVDIRVFNYISHTMNVNDQFFITQMMRSILLKDVFLTSPDNIVRDYIGPTDFHRLISLVLKSDPLNKAIDCYTKEPISKFLLLDCMKEKEGLIYKIQKNENFLDSTGFKLNYYSLNKTAEEFGYRPTKTSLETVEYEVSKISKS